MPREMTMPVRQEAEASALKGGKRNSIFYVPLPNGKAAKGKGNNKLYFGLMVPAAWPLYDVKPDHPLCLPGAVPPDLATFYWKLFAHYVHVAMPDGTLKQAWVMCQKEQNKWHTEVMKYPPLFRDDRCRICEETSAWWAKFNEEWSKTTWQGQPLPDRWSMKREDSDRVIAANPVLSHMSAEAKKWGNRTRYIYHVFDISKALRERSLDTGETQVDYQLWFGGPKSVFDALDALITNGVKFYDSQRPTTILVTKDCSRGAQFAEYTASNIGLYNATAEEKAYFDDESQWCQVVAGRPGEDDALIYMLSYEDQRQYCALSGPPGSGSTHDPAGFDPSKMERAEPQFAPRRGAADEIRPYTGPDVAPQPIPQQTYQPPAVPPALHVAPPPAPVAPVAPVAEALVPPPVASAPASAAEGSAPRRNRRGSNSW